VANGCFIGQLAGRDHHVPETRKEDAVTLIAEHAKLIGFFVVGVAVLVAAAIDLRRFRVPNAVTFPLCLSGLLFHLIIEGLAGLRFSAGGMAVGMCVLIIFYVMGVMGAGDVKLLAAVGSWIGASYTIYVFVIAGLAAGVHSLVVLAWQHRLRHVPLVFQVTFLQLMTLGRHVATEDSEPLTTCIHRADRARHVMPFAVMIAIGVVLVAVWEFKA
jgi:prepilin peptidase CpaA